MKEVRNVHAPGVYDLREKPAAVAVSYRLKNVGSMWGGILGSRAAIEMVRKVNETYNEPCCSSKPATKFVKCATGVVYQTPLDCKCCNVVRSGRCLNDSLGSTMQL